jgi:hypothetical protein
VAVGTQEDSNTGNPTPLIFRIEGAAVSGPRRITPASPMAEAMWGPAFTPLNASGRVQST